MLILYVNKIYNVFTCVKTEKVDKVLAKLAQPLMKENITKHGRILFERSSLVANSSLHFLSGSLSQ